MQYTFGQNGARTYPQPPQLRYSTLYPKAKYFARNPTKPALPSFPNMGLPQNEISPIRIPTHIPTNDETKIVTGTNFPDAHTRADGTPFSNLVFCGRPLVFITVLCPPFPLCIHSRRVFLQPHLYICRTTIIRYCNCLRFISFESEV